MQAWHGSRLDVAAEARSHHIFIAASKTLDEGAQLAKIISAVGVAHQNILAANKWKGIDISAAQPPLRRFQNAGAPGQRNLGGSIGRTVNDHDLASDVRVHKTLPAPIH